MPVKIKSVLITGGSSGIGAMLAKVLALRGIHVLISGRRKASLENVAVEAQTMQSCCGDINDPEHRSALTTRFAAMPAPRGIFHGAGYFQTGLLNDLTMDDWQLSFDTNVTSRWDLSRRCADYLDHGRVLFIGSDAGANPRVGAAAYSIAQAASETLRRALQAEWANRNIAITGFKPGLVDTPMVRSFMSLSEQKFPALPTYKEYVSKGRIADPEDIARFAAWLLLDVPATEFATSEWDVRNSQHHAAWCDRPLYPNTK